MALLPGPWCVFEDPQLNALMAAPVWAPAHCDDILPVVTGEKPVTALDRAIGLSRLRCRVNIAEEQGGETVHVAFADHGRQFQMVIHHRPHAGEGLLTPAISSAGTATRRTLALKRLADLADSGELRPHLYPVETRGPRFARILQALDGALHGARHRDVALILFGADRVGRDWALPDNHLRDHVRRAIAQGRALMGQGCLRLIP